jgi:RNA polymerase sigma factor (sigma-70 family)
MTNPESSYADQSHTTGLLLARIRSGDSLARQALVARVQPLLLRFAKGRVPHFLRGTQDTQDLIQLTWLKVLDRLDALECKEPGDFFSYLRTVLLNALREALRRHDQHPQDPIADTSTLAAQGTDTTDWLAYEQSLQKLEPQHRLLMILRFEFGMSFPEMAAELQESADGVRMKLGRAIKRVAELQ